VTAVSSLWVLPVVICFFSPTRNPQILPVLKGGTGAGATSCGAELLKKRKEKRKTEKKKETRIAAVDESQLAKAPTDYSNTLAMWEECRHQSVIKQWPGVCV
jgi:hypothetical protein